jgi:molecular chaperone GrpE
MKDKERHACATCEEYLNGWKRAQADYANLQKDMEKERTALRTYANEDLLHDVLPAIDQYDTALRHAPDLSTVPEPDKSRLENWLVGIRAVREIWEQAFDAIGLKTVRTDGEFDPEIHEAVNEEESDGKPGTILSVQQAGWMLKDKLLRPAKVVVSSGGNNHPERSGAEPKDPS